MKTTTIFLTMLAALTTAVYGQTTKPAAAKSTTAKALVARPIAKPSQEVAKETLIREIRFGYRELNLASALENDELAVTSDGLENDIARLESRSMESIQLDIDRYLVQQDKAAIETANWFSQVWSKSGDTSQQEALVDLEKRYNDLIDKCHPKVTATTLDEATANCADLHDAHETVSQFHIVGTPVSFFKQYAYVPSKGHTMLIADTLQLKADKLAPLNKSIKSALVQMDQQLIGPDKLIWVAEIDAAIGTTFEKDYPDARLADDDNLLKSVLALRKSISDINLSERKELLALAKQ